MGKMVMGSGAKLKMPTTKLETSFPVAYDDSELKSAMETVLADHKTVFQRLAEFEAKEPQKVIETKTVETIKEVSKLDSRARKHSTLLSKQVKDLAKSVQKLSEKSEIKMTPQQSLLPLIEALENKIECLEMLKPQEKHIVTKEIQVQKEIPKIVYIGLAVSIALNILVLILK